MIASRAELEGRLAELDARYAETPIPLPETGVAFGLFLHVLNFGKDATIACTIDLNTNYQGAIGLRDGSPHEQSPHLNICSINQINYSSSQAPAR